MVLNLLLAAYFLYSNTPGVSSYILLILMANMQMYFMYYVYCKLWYLFKEDRVGERIKIVTWFYGILAFISAVFAGKEEDNKVKQTCRCRPCYRCE